MRKKHTVLTILAVSLLACSFFSRGSVSAPATATVQETPTPAPALTVRHVAGSTQKICQLTGDIDRQTGQPTGNQTQTRFGIIGTDLGFSFLDGNRTWFLFGDTVGLHGGDSIAYTEDSTPEDCLDLTFVTGTDGNYNPPTVPGITLGAFEVPVAGFSANGSLYVFFTTGHTETKVMGRSVLARSDDGAHSFTNLYDVSNDKFINVVPVIVDNASIHGLPKSAGQGLLVFGTGTYRQSNPYLAYVPMDSVEKRSAWLFYAGTDHVSGSPNWSADEAAAVALFDHPCLGELSVSWMKDLHKWVMFYNCALPRGINMRSADTPWGQWTEGEVIFQPWNDGGYCYYMHVSYQDRNCDSVQDPGRDNVWAGEYGPYILPGLSRSQGGVTTVYFVMSTWNPYEVMLMKTDLKLEPAP
jgi:hypothetical protein